MVIRVFAKTDVGRVREHNEDNFLIDELHRAYVVADGMGGHNGGAQASALAVATYKTHLDEAGKLLLDDDLARLELRALTESTASLTPLDVLAEEALRDEAEDDDASELFAQNPPAGDLSAGPPQEPSDQARVASDEVAAAMPYVVYDVWDPGIQEDSLAPVIVRLLKDGVVKACRAIFEAAQNDPELTGMGTTATALCLHKSWAYVAHVGDSRCYMLRAGSLMQVTEDHSLVNEQIKAGLLTPELARVSRQKNIITRSVGFEPEVEVDSFVMPVRPGDQFVLCSDGLSNMLEDVEIGQTMTQASGQALVDTLVEMALDRGGDDNITVIAVELGEVNPLEHDPRPDEV